MTWTLAPPVQAGPFACSAVVETRVKARAIGRWITVRADKRPVLILCLRDGEVFGLDLHGRRVEEADIEQRFPQAIEQLAARGKEAG